MIRFRIDAATPASIVDAMKAGAGNPLKSRASFDKGRCVRGAYIPSDQVEEITKSRSFTRPSRVLARFLVGGSNPDVRLVIIGAGFAGMYAALSASGAFTAERIRAIREAISGPVSN